MSESDRISKLENSLGTIQDQLSLLIKAQLGSSTVQHVTQEPMKTKAQQEFDDNLPKTGTLIRDGLTVHQIGGLPSDREGIVKLHHEDHVGDYYNKKRYSTNPIKGGVMKGNIDPHLTQDAPKSVAEMPEPDHPTSSSAESFSDIVTDEAVVESLNQAVVGITPETKRLLDLVLGKTSAATKAEYLKELIGVLQGLGITEELSVDVVGKLLTTTLEGLKEEYLKELVVRAAPEFLEYVEELQGEALVKDYIAESLKTFMESIPREELEVVKSKIGIAISGVGAPYLLSDTVFLSSKDHTGEAYLVASNTHASKDDQSYLERMVLKGDMIIISFKDLKISARYVGTEVDSHNNIVHKLVEAQEDSDESALPPGLSHLA